MYCETLKPVNRDVIDSRPNRPYFACPFMQGHKTWRYVPGVVWKERRQSGG